MDKLKDYIDSNRESFEDYVLPKGHEARFEKKLSKRSNRNIMMWTLTALTAAAMICFALLADFGPMQNLRNTEASKGDCAMSREVDELRYYYNMRLYDLLGQMESITEAYPNPDTKALLAEGQKVKKEAAKFEDNVLPKLPCSNVALTVIDRQYKANIESLNIMLEQMNNLK